MPENETPFADALRRLHEADIRFVLIGGFAMGLHGATYPTVDVDVAYAAETEYARRLASLNLTTDFGAVDVMREVPGVDSFGELWARAVSMEVGGFVVRVASLADLIAMKRAANRPKDHAHLRELLALQRLSSGDDTEPDR